MIDNLTIGQRIKLLRLKNNLSQQAVSEACKVSRGLIAQIESDNTNPNLEILPVLVRIFNTSFEYLIEGKKSDYKDQESPLLIVSEPPAEFKILPKQTNQVEGIPIMDIKAAAGNGYINDPNATFDEVIQLPSHLLKGKQHICIRIKGDSMAPTLHDSGYLIIRQLEKSEWAFIPDGRIYVVSDLENQVYLKRVKNRLDRGFIVMTSDNPDKASHPNFNLKAEELATIWYVEWYFTAKMPNIHDNFYSKLTQLEDSIEELTSEFQQFKRKHP